MRKLLIVDDEFIVRMGIRSIVDWEQHGYSIVGEAADGKAALSLMESVRPDIVLTDLIMETMDGFELIRQSRKRFPHVKFVVLSNYNDFENVKQAMKLGASDYIFKMTAKPEEILRVLDEVSATIQEEPHAMDALVQRNRQAIKQSVFCKCIRQQYRDVSQQESEFAALGLEPDLNRPYVLVYVMVRPLSLEDRLVLRGKEPDSVLEFAMGNIVDEVWKACWKADTFSIDPEMMVSVLNLNSRPPYEAEFAEMREKFRLIREYIRRYLNLTVYGVLSDVGESYAQMKELHQRCMEAEMAYSGETEMLTCSRQRPGIIKVREYIEKHLREPIPIAKAAEIACMSESYFSSVFKKEVGISFVDYINQVRIRRAKVLLRQKHVKIYEICQEVGIENPNYFSLLFKKIEGISPNAYRSIAGGQDAEE